MKEKIMYKLSILITKRIIRSDIYLCGFLEGARFCGAISENELFQLKRELGVEREYYVARKEGGAGFDYYRG